MFRGRDSRFVIRDDWYSDCDAGGDGGEDVKRQARRGDEEQVEWEWARTSRSLIEELKST